MAKTRELPNGKVLSFPDDTPDSIINKVLAKYGVKPQEDAPIYTRKEKPPAPKEIALSEENKIFMRLLDAITALNKTIKEPEEKDETRLLEATLETNVKLEVLTSKIEALIEVIGKDKTVIRDPVTQRIEKVIVEK